MASQMHPLHDSPISKAIAIRASHRIGLMVLFAAVLTVKFLPHRAAFSGKDHVRDDHIIGLGAPCRLA